MNNSLLSAALIVCCAVSLRAKQLCLVGDFDSQLQYLEDNVMLTPEEIANLSQVYDDVQDTVRRRWQGAEVLPYGSLATGAALKLSDADCFVKIPNFNTSADLYVLEEITKLFQQQPKLYSQLMPFSSTTNQTSSLFTFYHIPTGRYGDILFTSRAGLETSRLTGYFFKLDKRVRPLVCILKFWSRIHQLTGPNMLTNFGLYSLVIFYLQQKNMAPSIYLLQKDLDSYIVDDWDMSFNELPYNSTNTENIYQLLGGFFKYYSEFNFEDYIVSPFAGRPIHRSAFADINNVPEEFSLYKIKLEKGETTPLTTNTDLCIQEAFEHNQNMAQRIKYEQALKFTSHVQFAARMFQNLPSDRFLRSILIKDQHNEIFTRAKQIIVDQVSKLKYCLNVTET